MNFKQRQKLESLKKKLNKDWLKDHLLEGAISLVVVAALCGAVFFLAQPNKGPEIAKEQNEPVEEKEVVVSPFDGIQIEGRSAIVLDLETGEPLYQKDADRVLPLASLTKVMTAVTALELIPHYTVVTIDPSFLEEEGDAGLFSNESWRLKDLLDFSLVTSSNDASRAVASVAGAVSNGSGVYDVGRDDFIEEMNREAGRLGLTRTKFWNETGLDVDEVQSGGYGSARDMAHLLKYVLAEHPNLLEATTDERGSASSLTNTHSIKNTNEFANDIPGLIGSKTGFTDLAGGNLMVVFNAGLRQPVAVVVLGSSYDGRFTDVMKLAAAARGHIAQMTLAEKEELLAQAKEE